METCTQKNIQQQTQKIKIFCVIPAYNEAANIVSVINSVKPLVDKVIVIDDCSCDNTCLLAKKQNIIVLKHLVNRGQGAALKTGTKYAIKENADIIVHFDADNQFLASEIKNVVKPIINGQADIVFGSRFLNQQNNISIPRIKKYILIPLAKLVNRLFLNVNLTDPQSGFRAMTKQTAKIINVQQDRMAHCSEILYQAIKHHLRIKEVPITVIYHNFGQCFSDGLKILTDLFLAKFID
ncbi:MAG: glycosyltransferase family 2 protein [Patescibacteria group bacterium]|nr:glycosyltransferase family 2 protein [Patescibacteria group bacterium]MBU1871011.1 glycosyltransferase family 2 protein [Patescibacteria group bacterium]